MSLPEPLTTSTPRHVVVSDTTPLITLAEVGAIDLLKALFTQVWIPPAVFSEYQAGILSHAARPDLTQIGWITIHPTLPDSAVPPSLDPGEAETISLARQIQVTVLLIDEQRGRAAAKRLGLTVSSSLGVLLDAKGQGYIPLVGPYLDQMIAQGRHIGSQLRMQILSLAGEE